MREPSLDRINILDELHVELGVCLDDEILTVGSNCFVVRRKEPIYVQDRVKCGHLKAEANNREAFIRLNQTSILLFKAELYYSVVACILIRWVARHVYSYLRDLKIHIEVYFAQSVIEPF